MLCMPVFNADQKLIGVTQLINKKRQGELPPLQPGRLAAGPRTVESEFQSHDMEFMKAFNIQAGVALQNAILFAEVKQQETR